MYFLHEINNSTLIPSQSLVIKVKKLLDKKNILYNERTVHF